MKSIGASFLIGSIGVLWNPSFSIFTSMTSRIQHFWKGVIADSTSVTHYLFFLSVLLRSLTLMFVFSHLLWRPLGMEFWLTQWFTKSNCLSTLKGNSYFVSSFSLSLANVVKVHVQIKKKKHEFCLHTLGWWNWTELHHLHRRENVVAKWTAYIP